MRTLTIAKPWWIMGVVALAVAFLLPTDTVSAAERKTTVDRSGDVGLFTSLALDINGFPVVSYWDFTNTALKVMHCTNPACNGPKSITTPDPDNTANVGHYTSLALDSDGFPVVSYWDNTNSDLKVMHCNDANCAGLDESITSPDTAGVVGLFTSLALDSNGFPVVSYWDDTNDDLKVMHCNDANCSGGDESITSPDNTDPIGPYTSLALDSNGFPVVSYFGTNSDLKVMHCNDANCAGLDENITSPDTVGVVGLFTSLALDSNGFPVVGYWDNTNTDLKVMHCNDANCAGLDESITSPDTGGSVGEHTSLALDSSGFPVVSYYHQNQANLRLLLCDDPNCS